MSKSRLEKFLYALYSLDSSDLPTPLSRIEELYKCLVTGEEPPTFEPLSRVEKYLMAILGVYDVDSLPNPLSRVEVLLYKLAMGDDNLDDVKSFLSEHEELLAEIIRNGGVGGNIDIEYVLYTLSTGYSTLYNTAEKPVKSAILTGQTLVNISENIQTITRSLKGWYQEEKLMDSIDKVKRNTYYTLLFKLEDVSGNHAQYNTIGLGLGQTTYLKEITLVNPVIDKNGGWCKAKFQLTDDFIEQNQSYTKLYIRPIRRNTPPVDGESIAYTIRGFAILEGDYTTNPVPFNEVFEGMQSVKMPVLKATGKNLLDTTSMWFNGYASNSSEIKKSNSTKSLIVKVKPNTSYTFTRTQLTNRCVISSFKGNHEDLPTTKLLYDGSGSYTENPVQFTTLDDTEYVIIYVHHEPTTPNGWVEHGIYQLEEGSIATSFESYKSNILTVSEDVTLRGIGEVQDTLDLVTGEVTERIGEVVLDGSESWIHHSSKTSTNVYRLPYSKLAHVENRILCDKLPVAASGDVEKIAASGDVGTTSYHAFYIALSKTKANTLSDFKSYLSENPLVVQYQLETPSVKTVDLSVVDQDGNNTEISTFNDITHVTLSSEGLIPEAELEVAEKVTEVEASMLTISREQEVIDTATNEQSENVDATMIATTEIYEGLL